MKKLNKKTLIVIISAVLVVAAAVAGTLAWLQDNAEGNVTLQGSDHVTVTLADASLGTMKVIPGQKVTYNPQVTVDNTVDAFVFVQINDTNNVLGANPALVDGWTALQNGVYYRTVAADAETKTFSFFNGGQITIDSNLNNDTISSINNQTFGIKAYAIQSAWINGEATGTTATEAWTAVSGN